MNIGPRGGRYDDGFSLVEVMVASFVLFFVITAILALTLQSTRMGVDAKQRTVMTNAVTSQLEWIRTLDFEHLADVVPAESVRTVDGFTVRTQTSITEGQAGTKEIVVTVSVSRTGTRTLSTTRFLTMRDPEKALQASDQTGPILEFTSQTPDENSVVFGANVWGGSTLYITVKASGRGSGVTIDELKYMCAGGYLRNGTSGSSDNAVWQPMTNTVTQSFRWHTLQIDPNIQDGWRIVTVEATDSDGYTSRIGRMFYVDNAPPSPPGVPVPVVRTNTDTRLNWAAALDGTHDAREYGVWPRAENSEGQMVYTIHPDDDPIKVPVAVYNHTGATFSRYTIDVGALSPRYQRPPIEDRRSPAKPFVTKPLATGTSISRYDADRHWYGIVNLSVSQPTFPVSYIRYDLYMGLSKDNMFLYVSDCGPTYTNPQMPSAAEISAMTGNPPVFAPYKQIAKRTNNDRTPPDPWLFQYRVTFVPSGYQGGTQETVFSNVIGPITATKNTVTPMAHVDW